MCIKFAFRRNLIYPIQYIIWSFGREILSFIIFKLINFTNNAVYLPTMFFGEIFAGGIFYLYEKRVMKSIKKEKEEKGEDSEKYFMSIKLIENEKEEDDYFTPLDSKIKIIFLIFLSALFDAVLFLLSHIVIPHYELLSISFCPRLYGLSTIFAALFCVHVLNLPVFRHHKVCLSIIGFCLIAVVATEYYFMKSNSFLSYSYLHTGLGYAIISQILIAWKDTLEKYLFEYDFMDPFVVLMYEGIFGFLLSFFLFFRRNYLKDFKDYYISHPDDSSPLLIKLGISLTFFMLISGAKNLFRVVTTLK